ncbi:Tmem238 [Columba livia]|nr:Tmem238 [Columba livia]
MAAPGGLGRCVAAFWLALAFDALGLAVLLAGVFADVFFSDLLIYAGGIGIFLSLIWWVFWYAGNLEVPPEELRDDGLLKTRLPMLLPLKVGKYCKLWKENSLLNEIGFPRD